MLFNKLKKKYNSIIGHKIKLFLTKNVWVSLGENCLTDNILSRYKLKSFTSPYSHGRSNIDYAIALEKIQYSGLLSLEHLSHQKHKESTVVRSTLINTCDDIFNPMHMEGFEFTHHNVIDSEKARDSASRKIKRLLTLRGRKNFFFLYHYRVSDNNNLDALIDKVKRYAKYYATDGKKCNVIVFTQKLIENKKDRKVQYHNYDTNIHFFEFHTLDAWEGNDDELLWARVDDDLIVKMMDACKAIEKGIFKKDNGYL